MEQRNSTCHALGPGCSTGTEGGRGNERKGGSLQLRKGGVHVETDRAVALLDFACSPGSQTALRSTRTIPRSRLACGAFNGEITATGCFGAVFLPETTEISVISGVDAGTRRLVEVTSPNKAFYLSIPHFYYINFSGFPVDARCGGVNSRRGAPSRELEWAGFEAASKSNRGEAGLRVPKSRLETESQVVNFKLTLS